jgi:hypothetical protein
MNPCTWHFLFLAIHIEFLFRVPAWGNGLCQQKENNNIINDFNDEPKKMVQNVYNSNLKAVPLGHEGTKGDRK